MSMTIKEIADELEVTKPAIRKLMDDGFRKQFVSVSRNTIQIDDKGLTLIRRHFNGNETKTVSAKKPETETVSSQKQVETETGKTETSFHQISAEKELISVLKSELAQRNSELAEMRKLLDQNQQLLLNSQNENQKLLALQAPDSTAPSSTAEGEYSEVQPETGNRKRSETKARQQKRHWWNRK